MMPSTCHLEPLNKPPSIREDEQHQSQSRERGSQRKDPPFGVLLSNTSSAKVISKLFTTYQECPAMADRDISSNSVVNDAPTGAAETPNKSGRVTTRLPKCHSTRRTAQYFVPIARILGLSSFIILMVVLGYTTRPTTNDSRRGSATTIPAQQRVSQVSSVDIVALSRQVNPIEGYALPVKFGNIGPQLLAKGAIDYNRFAQLYQQLGQPLTDEQVAVLVSGSDAPIIFRSYNAHFLLNFFWALGLTNQNRILTEGPMMQRGRNQVGNYASTGGWTIGAKVAMELYASAPIITLTSEQQARVEQVASAVYRPCCDNPTHFPDCNHGMAMLGVLELMAAQDVSVEGLFTAAKYINAFWFPQQTLELATYFKASQGLDFAQVDPRQLVGSEFSSASGFQAVHQWLADKGLLQQTNGGASCGVR